MSKAPDQYVYGVHPIYIESGKGCVVKDIDGNKYIDYPCGLGAVILGYGHKRTVKAVKKQMEKGSIFSLMHPMEVELAELLHEVIPCAEQVRYGKNGSDVTSIAVRVARSYTGKDHLLSPEGHYHGWADFFAASTTRDYGLPKCLKELVEHFQYNNLDSLEDKLKTGKFAAVIMEPVALEPPESGFLEGVRELCTKYKALLIFDEMITGFRLALGGAQEYYGVTPDLATFGKAVSNGMPISILAGRKEYMKELDYVFFSSTFGGEVCSISAAVETVKELKEKRGEIYPHLWHYGGIIRESFEQLCEKNGIDAHIAGIGPRLVANFNTDDPGGHKDVFCQEMVKRSILMGNNINVIWAHKEKHIEKTIKAMKKSLKIVGKAIADGSVNKYLEGERSTGIFKKEISGDKS
jgi:glutamate-1-semialdehyde 2,1-aminomutase/spore coat polysaccharide biosynthesis protein SpsF